MSDIAGIIKRTGRSIFLTAALAVGQEGIDDATLPAAEPPNPRAAPTSREEDKVENAIQTEFKVGQVYQEIGRVKSVVESIDLYFKTNPSKKEEASKWQEERKAYLNFANDVERLMEGSPTAELRNAFGRGLSLNAQSLQLYLNSIASQAVMDNNNLPERRQETGRRPGNQAPNNLPPVVGMYDRTQFLGLRNGAVILGPLLEAEFKKGGKELTPAQTSIVEGLTKIKNAQDPDQLSNELMPVVQNLANSLLQYRSQNARNASGQSPELVKGLDGFLGQLGVELPGRRTQQPEVLIKSGDPANDWYDSWIDRVSRDKTPRLHPGGREGSQINKFAEILRNKEGLVMVQEGAKHYKAILSKVEEPELYADLIKDIDQIVAAKSAEDLKTIFNDKSDKLTFQDLKQSFETMLKAREAYQRESSGR